MCRVDFSAKYRVVCRSSGGGCIASADFLRNLVTFRSSYPSGRHF